jgi:hypothetical protein
VFRDSDEPLLVIGNPPWVTSSELGALESKNLPHKQNSKNFSGLDALTGKANFDVSEWMILRLLPALKNMNFTIALLCKAIVARRVLERFANEKWRVQGELRDIDAMEHFGAAVDAVLLTLRADRGAGDSPSMCWPRYRSIGAASPSTTLGFIAGTTTPNIQAFLSTKRFIGVCEPEWRSGLKHDCSAVMEFTRDTDRLTSRAGGSVDLEPEYIFPMMKGSDVANCRWPPSRAMLVPQRSLGQETRVIRKVAPKTWAYLKTHSGALAARKSSIYTNQPPFSIFGVGDYTFTPWKVAIAGLYKKLSFMIVGPWNDRPVVLDDTTYFLAFDTESEARSAHAALTSDIASHFFRARVFWDDKRPINKKVLQSLDLHELQRHLGLIKKRPTAPSDTSL